MSRCSGSTSIVKESPRGQDGWTKSDIRKLVCLYRRNPCLWKRDDEFYLDGERRCRAYERIHRDMIICRNPDDTRVTSFIEIMMKLREMRKSYVTELKKVLESESTCCRYEPTAKWFYELHHFLYPYLDYDETLELHYIADRSIAEDSHKYPRQKTPFLSSPRETMKRESSLKTTERFTDSLMKRKSPGSSKRKATSSMSRSHRRSPTACTTTRLTYRAPNGLLSRSSGDSSTGLASSYSDTHIGSSASTVICDNRLTYHCRPSSYEREDVSSENLTSSNLENEPIEGTNNLSTHRKLRRVVESDNFEIFAMQVACQLRKMKVCNARRAQTDIRKILNDRVVGSNINANTSSKRNPVSRARTLSTTFLPCSISICQRNDCPSRMNRVGKIRTTNERSPQIKCESRSHEGSTGRSIGSRNSPKNHRSFRPPSCCSTPKRPCTRR